MLGRETPGPLGQGRGSPGQLGVKTRGWGLARGLIYWARVQNDSDSWAHPVGHPLCQMAARHRGCRRDPPKGLTTRRLPARGADVGLLSRQPGRERGRRCSRVGCGEGGEGRVRAGRPLRPRPVCNLGSVRDPRPGVLCTQACHDLTAHHGPAAQGTRRTCVARLPGASSVLLSFRVSWQETVGPLASQTREVWEMDAFWGGDYGLWDGQPWP